MGNQYLVAVIYQVVATVVLVGLRLVVVDQWAVGSPVAALPAVDSPVAD